MSFCVWVDPESNEDLYSANLFGQIYLQFDDVFFPEQGWGDFVCIVLSWWVRALGSLDNRPSTLGFMDGPFEVRLAFSKLDPVVCSCIRRNSKADTTVATSVVNLDTLMGSVKTAVLVTLDHHNTESRRDVEELRDAWDRYGW